MLAPLGSVLPYSFYGGASAVLSTDKASNIHKLYIWKSSLILFFLFLLGRSWLEIDLTRLLLYNRRSLERGPFRPAMDHQVNAP